MFFLLFLIDDRKIQIRIVPLSKGSGSGSRRTKNIRIRYTGACAKIIITWIAVVHGAPKGRAPHLLDQLAARIKDSQRAARAIRPHVQPAFRRLKRHQQPGFIIEKLGGGAQFRVVDVGDQAGLPGMGVHVLDGAAPVVLAADEPSLGVVIEAHGELARLKGARHLTQSVVGVALLAPADDKAPLVIRHKLEVAKLDDPVAGVIAQGHPLALLRDRDNIPVHIVGVDPAGAVRRAR